jgi:hypothetical protein
MRSGPVAMAAALRHPVRQLLPLILLQQLLWGQAQAQARVREPVRSFVTRNGSVLMLEGQVRRRGRPLTPVAPCGPPSCA